MIPLVALPHDSCPANPVILNTVNFVRNRSLYFFPRGEILDTSLNKCKINTNGEFSIVFLSSWQTAGMSETGCWGKQAGFDVTMYQRLPPGHTQSTDVFG